MYRERNRVERMMSPEDHPSVGELRNVSAKYEIGFSSLLMPDVLPPETRLKLQDFRTHGSGAPGKWNPELLMEMDDINVLIDAMGKGMAGTALHTFRKAHFRCRVLDAYWSGNASILNDGGSEKT